MTIKKKLIYLMILIAFALFITACSSGGTEETGGSAETNDDAEATEEVSEEDKYGGKVTIRVSSQPRVFGIAHEVAFNPSPTMPISMAALESLGRFDSNGEMQPHLAKEWEMDPEAKTVTLTLEEGVKFHDGTDFNADAVKFTFDRVIDNHPVLSSIGEVEVIDDHNLVFHFETWGTGALQKMFIVVPFGSPTAYEEMGEEGNWNHPVGTGPFVFDSMENDNFVKFVKNENYWKGGLPYLDEVEYKFINNNTTALNGVLGGEIDVALHLPADIISQQENNDQIEIVEPKTSMGLQFIGLISNLDEEGSPLQDVNVRKAISYAIDREAIAESVFHGHAVPMTQIQLPGDIGYNEEMEQFEYNPEKAKELLAEAGYADGFETTVVTQSDRSFLMQAVQGYLADIGIELEVDVVEGARLMAMIYDEGWSGFTEYITYTSGNELATIVTPGLGPSPALWGTIFDVPQNITDLIVKFNQTADAEEQSQVGQDLSAAIFDEHAVITPLLLANVPYIKQPHVEDDGFYTTNADFYTPEYMYVTE